MELDLDNNDEEKRKVKRVGEKDKSIEKYIEGKLEKLNEREKC